MTNLTLSQSLTPEKLVGVRRAWFVAIRWNAFSAGADVGCVGATAAVVAVVVVTRDDDSASGSLV